MQTVVVVCYNDSMVFNVLKITIRRCSWQTSWSKFLKFDIGFAFFS